MKTKLGSGLSRGRVEAVGEVIVSLFVGEQIVGVAHEVKEAVTSLGATRMSAEQHVYPPSAGAVKGAWVSGMPAYQALVDEAARDYEGYWARLARELISWRAPFRRVLNDDTPPFFKWFEDGTLNASYNCLDRNVEQGRGDKTAIIFEADDGAVTKVSYSELLARTCKLANAMKARGIVKGDRVVIYMPMSIEGGVAMLACARIGATHSVVFGGFSAQSL